MSIEKALTILELFFKNRKDLSLKEISLATKISLSTAHRICNLLSLNGYLTKNTSSKKYFLGPKIPALSRIFFLDNILFKTAIPFLEELSSDIKAPANLMILNADYALLVHRVDIENVLSAYIKVGSIFPLYCTAAGKLLLSFSKDNYINYYFEKIILKKFTEYTNIDRAKILAELKLIKENNYSVSEKEYNEDLIVIGSPIKSAFGDVLASFSFEFLAHKISREKLISDFSSIIVYTGQQISERLGCMQY